MNRRQFLAASTVTAAAAPLAAAPGIDLSKQCRQDFPRALNETYFNSAAQHPLGNHTVRGMHRYIEFLHKGPGEGRQDFWEHGFGEVKGMFARLIGAKPSEIAYCGSTTIGENILVNGMDFRGKNIVTNDLHYSASLANYLQRRDLGIEVRIVKHKDWHIDPSEMERAVDKNTKLIAVSWVSSVNGHVENLKALSDLAHSHGGYLYADIIQGCGAVPLDVKASGVDMASCAMYKWLQGEHGYGFLYLREDLAGSVVKPTELTGHPDMNYRPWTSTPKAGEPELINHRSKGVAMLDCGTPSVITYAAQHESFRYIEKLGVANIRAHADNLTARLRKQIAGLGGYECITPADHRSSIITFRCADPAKTRRKLEEANKAGRAKILLTGPNSALTVGRFGNHLRFSVSVFNNEQDVDTVTGVLS
ncbi:MAG: aminotransferase class V-fold PLP-dependent enzyme [Bryobacterales bacterium]|nr:aminotransferase class V-fold PLP-dependent enzyme [Bryobacterales bacterium]